MPDLIRHPVSYDMKTYIKNRISILLCVLAIWPCVGVMPFQMGPLGSAAWSGTAVEGQSVDPAQLTASIHLAADYLIKRCNHNGKFLYRINLNPETTLKPKYNFLRHAGAIYALGQYEAAYPDTATLQTMKRAALFLKKASIDPIPEKFAPVPIRNDLLAVWSIPAVTGSEKPIQAKLGGTGLGLVALVSLENIAPGTTPLEYLRQMGNFIIFMQKKDGSFYSKFYPQHGGKNDEWTSLYYPGEAALGLIMLYELDPDPKWLQAAADAIAYLARLRKEKSQVAADHWALLATARLLPLYDRSRQALPKAAIVDHAVQISESILETAAHYPETSLAHGCLTDDGRTTPTAIRLEGLLAALDIIPDENRLLKKQIVISAREGIGFLLRSQVKSGEYAGAIPRAIRPLPENHAKFSKSFNRRATEVRIDNVQHALSAMLQYQQLFFPKKVLTSLSIPFNYQ
jgi:hypothetical protein